METQACLIQLLVRLVESPTSDSSNLQVFRFCPLPCLSSFYSLLTQFLLLPSLCLFLWIVPPESSLKDSGVLSYFLSIILVCSPLNFYFLPSVTVSHPHLPPPLSAPLSGQGGDSRRSIKCWHHLASHLSGSWLRGRGRKRRREMRWGVKVRLILSRSSRSHMCSCFHHFRRRYTDFISRITTFNITKQNAHFYQKMLP